MLDFAVRWMPYGGGEAEDIMVTFGMSPETYFRRLEHVLTHPAQPTGLDAPSVQALHRVCRHRLDSEVRRVEVGRSPLTDPFRPGVSPHVAR